MSGIVARIAEAGLLGLVVFAPLPFGSNVYWADFVLSAGSLILLALWLVSNRRVDGVPVYRERRGGSPGLPARTLIPFAVFLAVPLIQLLPLPVGVIQTVNGSRAVLAAMAAPGFSWATVSVYPHETARMLLRYAGWVAIAVVAYGTIRSRGAARRFAWVLALSGAWQAFYGTIEFLSGRQRIFGFEKAHYLDRATGTFINHNHYAAYLALAFGAAWGLLLFYLGRSGRGVQRGEARIERAAFVFFVLVMIGLGIVFSGSRGGLVALAIGVLAFAVVGPLARKRWQRPLVAALVVACVVASTFWIGRAPMAERIDEVADDLPTLNQRTYAWRTSLAMIADAPILGGGAGTYGWRFPRYRPGPDGGNFRHAHSDYLEWTADLGVVGAAALACAIGMVLAFAARRRAERHSRLSRTMSFGALFGLATVLIHAAFDFPLAIPGIATTFFAVLGFAAATATRRLE